LTGAGLRLIAPDAPGFGRSPALPADRYSIESLVDLVRGILDDRGIHRALLMGHSWGGTVMTAFVAAEPQRVEGLVLIDSGHIDYQEMPSFPRGRSLEQLIEDARGPERQIRIAGWEAFEAHAQEGVRRPVTPELLEAFRAAIQERDGELVGIATPEARGAALYGVTQVRVTSTWEAIAAAGIPILLLLATEPEETRALNERAAETFVDRFPDAEIHYLEDAGHDLFADAGPDVARLVRDWAGRIEGRTYNRANAHDR
jgi:pimeloyl-ACP methyl ester carboxylesterase